MYKCHICKEIECFDIVNNLVLHYKIIHNLKANDDFQCFNCQQVYSLKSFRRHFKRSCKEISLNRDNFPFTATNILTAPTTNTDFELSQDVLPRDQNAIDILKTVEKSSIHFLCSLYGKPNLTRKLVEEIIQDITESFFKIIFKNIAEEFSSHINVTKVQHFKNILTALQNPFESVKTFHKFVQKTKDYNVYQDPSSFVIHNEVCEKSGITPSIDIVESDGIILPLHFQFQKFFELPGVYKSVKENTKNLISNSVPHLITTKIWKERISKFPSVKQENIIPFNLYFDDFESNNPLGSHGGCHSIGAVYYNFPSLPQWICSELDNIFVAMLFYSKYKNHGENAIFSELVKEIKKLEENGVTIKLLSGEYYQIFFVLGVITGDNLGLNTIMGYTKSFSSQFPCRICKCTKSEIYKKCKDDCNFHRNLKNYNRDTIQYTRVNERIANSGIREISVFNNIPSFHVVENLTVDIMHDLFEGVCHYDLCELINQFVIQDDFFSLDVLNNRTQLFIYGESENGNKPTVIKPDHVKKKKLNMSAREMWTFCRFLPIIIGDLVPRKNKHWELLINLNKIIDITLKSNFQETDLLTLENLISKHHDLYIQLFNANLKPKFHFMIHYPYVMKMIGPLKHFWSFRFESKHKVLKSYCNNTTSRRNLPLSLGIKSSLVFCQRIMSHTGIPEMISKLSKPGIIFKNQQFFFKLQNLATVCFHELCCYNALTYCKVPYTHNQYVSISTVKTTNIYRIECLIIFKDCPYIVCEKINTSEYLDHFNSYEICNGTELFYVYNIKDLNGPPVNHFFNPNGKKFTFVKFF